LLLHCLLPGFLPTCRFRYLFQRDSGEYREFRGLVEKYRNGELVDSDSDSEDGVGEKAYDAAEDSTSTSSSNSSIRRRVRRAISSSSSSSSSSSDEEGKKPYDPTEINSSDSEDEQKSLKNVKKEHFSDDFDIRPIISGKFVFPYKVPSAKYSKKSILCPRLGAE